MSALVATEPADLDTERADRLARLHRQAKTAGIAADSWSKRSVTLLIQLGDALNKMQDAAISEAVWVARIAVEGESVEAFESAGTYTLAACEAIAQKTVGTVDVIEVRAPKPLEKRQVN
jgi:hypothetical protein